MSLEDDLVRIIDGPGTKADRARQLFALGCDRSDVSELLDMSYSQAHQIYKRLQEDGASVRSTASVRKLREEHEGVGRSRHSLRMSPTQVRVATQDGHRVIRVDKESGPVCRNCDRTLNFSIKWLAFVHTGSKADPVSLEDHYD